MFGFTLKAQRPPEPRSVAPGVVQRIEHVYEIDPEKMQTFPQQDIPLWDTHRIVASRWDHLDWMHAHWADEVISAELEPEIGPDAMPSEEHAEED